jgi:hypothetical protein
MANLHGDRLASWKPSVQYAQALAGDKTDFHQPPGQVKPGPSGKFGRRRHRAHRPRFAYTELIERSQLDI